MDERIVEIILIVLCLAILGTYSFRVKQPYPKWVFDAVGEPLWRFVYFLAVYLMSYFSFAASLLALIIGVVLNAEYNNLISQ